MTRKAPQPPMPDMDRESAMAVLESTCSRKKRCDSFHHARANARLLLESTGEATSPYRCPFSSLLGEDHWHTGHVPDIAATARIAAAVRWFGQNGMEW